MKAIRLYEYIAIPESPPIKFLGNSYTTIDIPTEFVVRKAEYCIPTKAKIYRTHRYFYNDMVLDCRGLTAELDREGKGFGGTIDYDEVRLLEIWHDCGDDGHVDYVLRGWVFVPQSHLDQCMEMMGEWDDLPFCMTHFPPWRGSYEDEFEERWQRYLEEKSEDI